jgi:hypothetical protein
VVCGVWCVVCGVWCVVCGVWWCVCVCVCWLCVRVECNNTARRRHKRERARVSGLIGCVVSRNLLDLLCWASWDLHWLGEEQERRPLSMHGTAQCRPAATSVKRTQGGRWSFVAPVSPRHPLRGPDSATGAAVSQCRPPERVTAAGDPSDRAAKDCRLRSHGQWTGARSRSQLDTLSPDARGLLPLDQQTLRGGAPSRQSMMSIDTSRYGDCDDQQSTTHL